MGVSAVTSSQTLAAGAYASAERLAATIPVRPIDPTRRRFQVDERLAPDRTPVPAVTAEDGADTAGDGVPAETSGGRAGGGFGLVGAVTAFLARIFASSEDAAASPQQGVSAYARAAATAAAATPAGTEILSGSFPRLSSGRAVDLSV